MVFARFMARRVLELMGRTLVIGGAGDFIHVHVCAACDGTIYFWQILVPYNSITDSGLKSLHMWYPLSSTSDLCTNRTDWQIRMYIIGTGLQDSSHVSKYQPLNKVC